MRRGEGGVSTVVSFTLREADYETDWSFWRMLHHVAEHDTVVRQFGVWDEPLQDGFARKAWDNVQGERWIVEVDGVPAGFWHVVERESEVYVNNLVIHPDWQKRGIGRALLQQAKARGTALGMDVTLQTLFENTARGLYEKEGFVVEGSSATHWRLRWRVPSSGHP